jgi:hypothetical protein
MRLYMGPTLAVVSMLLFYKYGEKVNVFIIGFILAYGVFYTIKPLIMVWAMKAKDESFSFQFKDQALLIKDRIKEGSIDLKRNRMQENKKYFFVTLDNKQVLFFPKEKLSEQARDLFWKHKNL